MVELQAHERSKRLGRAQPVESHPNRARPPARGGFQPAARPRARAPAPPA